MSCARKIRPYLSIDGLLQRSCQSLVFVRRAGTALLTRQLAFRVNIREKIEYVVSYVSLSSSQFGICSSFRQSLLRIQTSSIGLFEIYQGWRSCSRSVT